MAGRQLGLWLHQRGRRADCRDHFESVQPGDWPRGVRAGSIHGEQTDGRGLGLHEKQSPAGFARFHLTASFSTMLLATTYLSQAQQLGHFVKLDYIFPADRRRLAEAFPEYEVRLDPSPQAFFGDEPAA